MTALPTCRAARAWSRDPMSSPIGRLAPAVRIEVVAHHVDVLQPRQAHGVHALAAVPGPVVAAGLIGEEAFVADADQVPAVLRADEGRYVVGPRRDGVC